MEAGGRHHSLGQPGHLGPDLVPEHPDDCFEPYGDGDDRQEDGDEVDGEEDFEDDTFQTGEQDDVTVDEMDGLNVT